MIYSPGATSLQEYAANLRQITMCIWVTNYRSSFSTGEETKCFGDEHHFNDTESLHIVYFDVQ